jgi:hypothetical protein
MPAVLAFDEQQGIVCFALSGALVESQIMDEVTAFAAAHENYGEVCVLTVFQGDTNLSRMSVDVLSRLKDDLKKKLAQHGIVRRKSAFVFNDSIEARLIGPLWKGLTESDSETGFPIELFSRLDEAFEFLDCPPAAGFALVKAAAPHRRADPTRQPD